LKTEYLAKKLRDVQEEVCKKIDGFPVVGFCPPVSDSALDLPEAKYGTALIDSIRSEGLRIRKSAQTKVSSGDTDLTDEMKQLLQLWEQRKGFVDEIKKQVTTACEPMKIVMSSVQRDVEVMTRLTRYVDVLERALTSSDVSGIYVEMMELVECDYFRISEEDKKALKRAAGIEEEPTPEPVVPVVADTDAGSGASAAGATAADTAAGASTDLDYEMDGFFVFLNEQFDMLELNCNQLRSQYDLLQQQQSEVEASTSRTLGNLESMIADLRRQLREHGIPDPTEE